MSVKIQIKLQMKYSHAKEHREGADNLVQMQVGCGVIEYGLQLLVSGSFYKNDFLTDCIPLFNEQPNPIEIPHASVVGPVQHMLYATGDVCSLEVPCPRESSSHSNGSTWDYAC